MAWATASDVATRMGRTLTTSEQSTATAVITTVTGLITDVAGEDSAWATALSPVPTYFKTLCVEKAVSTINNPGAVNSYGLGAYWVRYSNEHGYGVFLTPEEERQVFRYVNNAVSGSVRTESLVRDVYVTEDS